MNPGDKPFSTSEGILAFCLYAAGAEFSDERLPCFHLFNPEILSKLGYRGETIWDAGQKAWKDGHRGEVQYSFKLSQRTHDLIQVYRAQRKELEDADGRASHFIQKVLTRAMGGEILPDEAILRLSCIILTTRGEFMNMWKRVVPILKIPHPGKVKHYDTIMDGKPAQGVSHPGFDLIPLNASESVKRKMKL